MPPASPLRRAIVQRRFNRGLSIKRPDTWLGDVHSVARRSTLFELDQRAPPTHDETATTGAPYASSAGLSLPAFRLSVLGRQSVLPDFGKRRILDRPSVLPGEVLWSWSA